MHIHVCRKLHQLQPMCHLLEFDLGLQILDSTWHNHSQMPNDYFALLRALCPAVNQHVFLAMRPLCTPGMAASSCAIDARNQICVYFMVGVSIGYFVVICYLCFWKLKQHKRFPIRVVQVGMLYFRLQVSLQMDVPNTTQSIAQHMSACLCLGVMVQGSSLL